jgi:hypothetical protein
MNDIKEHKKFMDWAANQLNIKDMEGWYNVTRTVTYKNNKTVIFQDLTNLGGASLLGKHNYSRIRLLSSVYPEYEWLPWKFQGTTRKYWEDINNQRKFLDWAAKQLNISDLSGWYNVTLNVSHHFSLPVIISRMYKN